MRGERVFIDPKGEQPLPIIIPRDAAIHKIIVAHGAVEACKSSSTENVYGSLAVSYKNHVGSNPPPFFVEFERAERIHVLDSFNLEIVLSELDTFSDFTSYIEEKESAIAKYDVLAYCGEEDLLAHYLMNYDQYFKRYRIGNSDPNINCVMIGEGEWKAYVEDGYQAKRSQANKQSYLWDELIQRTYQNALDGTTTGASLWDGRDALHEMAREPRLSRRALADQMLEAIRRFPKIYGHRVTYMPSIESDKSYVFLQVRFPAAAVDCGEVRRRMLEIACGVTRNMFSHLGIVVGITLDAPLYASSDGEDFLLLDCEYWSEEQRAYFNRANDQLGFFKNARKIARSTADFA